MIKLSKKLVTTAIPYVNAPPHLGHILEYVQTDVIARYYRLKGEDVFLLTGADENSLKNVQAAEAKNISIQELCDENTSKFIKAVEKMGFSSDKFIRTSNKKEHWPGVQKLWELCNKKGDIYKKKYSGLYCVGCEAFYKEEELEDGLCPEHKKPPVLVEEENYFFRLSKYQDQLKEIIEKDTYKILPKSRKNEVLKFIDGGLEDFSISRSVKRARGWGVPVPGDNSQIMYVWFDALGNYLTGGGYGTNDKLFKETWPADTHVIGKGITRFHAIYWPAMLLSAGIELPKTLFIHGYITIEGQKMSKSLGNILDPMKLIEKHSIDSIRYYLLSGVPTFLDGDFSESRLVEANNNELVANLGNLVNRTMVFVNRYFDSIVPECELTEKDKEFIKSQKEQYKKVEAFLDGLKLKEGLDAIMKISKNNNQYFQENEPWGLIKTDNKRCGTVIYVLLNQVKDLAIAIEPFMPFSSKKIFKQLNIEPKKWRDIGELSLKSGKEIGKAEILFQKIEVKQIMVEDPFAKLDLEIAEIVGVEKHPDADKLYIEKLKTLEGGRIIVSGLVGHYKPEELIGLKVILVKNLKPAKLKGVLSEGMLLAAETKEGEVEVINCPDANVGDKILLKGVEQKPAEEMDIKEFSKVKIKVRDNTVKTGDKEFAVNGKPVKTFKIERGIVR